MPAGIFLGRGGRRPRRGPLPGLQPKLERRHLAESHLDLAVHPVVGGERFFDCVFIRDSKRYEPAAQKEMLELRSKPFERAVEQALKAALAPTLDDGERDQTLESFTREGPVHSAAHPLPGRDCKAELHERLGHQWMEHGGRATYAAVEEMLDVDQACDMLALSRKSEKRCIQPGMRLGPPEQRIASKEAA